MVWYIIWPAGPLLEACAAVEAAEDVKARLVDHAAVVRAHRGLRLRVDASKCRRSGQMFMDFQDVSWAFP